MRRMYPKRRRRMCPFSASYYPFLSGEEGASSMRLLAAHRIQAPHTRDKKRSLVCGSLFLSGEEGKSQEQYAPKGNRRRIGKEIRIQGSARSMRSFAPLRTTLFPSPSPLRTIRVFLLFFYDFMALCPVDKDNFYNIIRELLCY